MKINQTISLLALGTVLSTVNATAQTNTGSGTINNSSSTYPQGAVVTDSLPKGRTNDRNTDRRRNRRNQNSRDNTYGNAPGTQDDRYRQSSSASGTSVNSSNTQNYNTNNATTPPTGVGSTPSTANNPAVVPGQQISNGQNNSTSRGSVGNSSQSVPSGSTATSGSSSGSTTPPDESMSGTGVSTSGTTTNRQLTTTPGATGTGMAVAGGSNGSNPTSAPGRSNNESVGDYVASAPDYSTLQNALQSTDMDKALMGSGTFTVFAPSNSAFKKLPAKMQNTLLEGQNMASLKTLLSYHVVEGTMDAKELARQINAGNGKAQLKTMSGGMLMARIGSNGRVMLTDEQGSVAYVESADRYQSNGVVHGIDKVLLPKGVAASFK